MSPNRFPCRVGAAAALALFALAGVSQPAAAGTVVFRGGRAVAVAPGARLAAPGFALRRGRRFGYARGAAVAGAFGGYGLSYEGSGVSDPFADQENGLPPGYEAEPSNYPRGRALAEGDYNSNGYHATSYGFTSHEAEGGMRCEPYRGPRPGVTRVCFH